MQKYAALIALLFALAGCGVHQGHYKGAPPVPSDAPPPTSLLSE